MTTTNRMFDGASAFNQPSDHETISHVLNEAFEFNRAFLNKIENREGIGENGLANLAFSPVDNTKGKDSDSNPTNLQRWEEEVGK